ncbi:hypothetical protein [Mesorhizobium sp. M1163]|uniref:hypothetical protein n=1 Tax=Mesorhizobium sp. M1163 TaxID=2957065 RepID=UPI00333DA707
MLHKIEERELDFFPALSQLAGVPVPEAGSSLAVLLYVLAAGWLLVPLLMPRRYSFGYYLAWTFFTSMGVIELAHFVFPLFMDGPYGYFPGHGKRHAARLCRLVGSLSDDICRCDQVGEMSH